MVFVDDPYTSIDDRAPCRGCSRCTRAQSAERPHAFLVIAPVYAAPGVMGDQSAGAMIRGRVFSSVFSAREARTISLLPSRGCGRSRGLAGRKGTRDCALTEQKCNDCRGVVGGGAEFGCQRSSSIGEKERIQQIGECPRCSRPARAQFSNLLRSTGPKASKAKNPSSAMSPERLRWANVIAGRAT